MNRTPLYDAHVAAGGRMVNFAGWEMPIQYSGVVDEYRAVRSTAGLFDVSHMGRIMVTGRDATVFLQRLTTNNVGRLDVSESHYSMICNPSGGIKDDVFIYRIGPDDFLLCVNASNREKIVAWLHEQAASAEVGIDDRTMTLAQLALQGPASRDIVRELGLDGIQALMPRRCRPVHVLGSASWMARTGYTGEVGYELYVPSDAASAVWNALLHLGKAAGLKPAALGARDLLRLEMAYLLYGNDIDEGTTPIEAGAEWVVDLSKPEFIGSRVLQQQHDEGVSRRLVAFELLEKAVPRHGYRIRAGGDLAGEPLGPVTSGNLSPILQKGIGLGYVPPPHAAMGTALTVEVRGRAVPARVVQPPFYKRRPT